MPAMLEDPTAPAIYRTSGRPPYPTPQNPQIPETIVPRPVTLRDRITIASLIPFSNPHDVPPRLLSYLCSQLNLEIEKGDTYPMMSAMPLATFGTYWFQNFGAVMLLGEVGSLQDVVQMEARGERWEEVCLGSFYVKPNYPGRSSHVCNGGFLVTEAARNRGVGRLMGEGYLEWAPKLGYTYSVFNLVYETNVASCRIWDALGFKRIGRIKSCGNLRSSPDDLVDAIIYGRDLGPEGEDFVSEERFDKIRYYLKHGTYPSGADRAEKSRLRSAATHYKLLGDEGGLGERLMLKDKEVVSDPQRQYEIARTVHASQHGGINKTTATIAEKFHWVRIKETVSLVIKNCPDCKESAAKAPTVRPLGDVNGASPAQARRAAAAGGGGGMQVDPNSMIERLVCFDQMDQRPLVNVNGGNGNGVEAPNAVAAIPVAEMRALQRYGDIPLDPQIMGHPPPPPLSSSSDQQQYTHHHHQHPPPSYLRPTTTSNSRDHNATTFTPSTQLNGTRNPNIDPDMEIEIPPPHHSGVDTRMATDRHVREGDEPMAFQHSRGRVGEVRGRGQGDEMDLEELLGR